jgi:hypothetical protein
MTVEEFLDKSPQLKGLGLRKVMLKDVRLGNCILISRFGVNHDGDLDLEWYLVKKVTENWGEGLVNTNKQFALNLDKEVYEVTSPASIIYKVPVDE